MTSEVWKRQKLAELPIGKPKKSILLVSGACLDLIGHCLSLDDFLRWRSTCNLILVCTRERCLRWQQYKHVFSNDDRVQALCTDMYGFLTSKIDAPDYYEANPHLVPMCYFPDPSQVARASIAMVAPAVLLRVPLRLLNALGGIDSLANLPRSPLLDRHFVHLSFTLERSSKKALLFTANDFHSPITLCFNEFVTVIVFRTLSGPFGIIDPISVMWYTCLNPLEWWCEFSTLPTMHYLYDVLHVSRDATYVVQVAQSPPSAMSFLRPYLRGGRAVPMSTHPENSIRYDVASLSHSTVWVAMEYLETLVSARAVTHVSITHHESIVRLADDVFPVGVKELLLVLDLAHTQIRLPLIFPTMPSSWTPATALASALCPFNAARPEEEQWDLSLVPMGVYREICDDECFPLTQSDVLNRLPVLMEHFFCDIMQAMHSLFSKGNRGLRPRLTTHAVVSLLHAANDMRTRLFDTSVLSGFNRHHRRDVPQLLSLFHDVATRETEDFIAPTVDSEVKGFRKHEVLLFESCRMDSSFFHPVDIKDDHLEATGEPSPEFMCNICSCKHMENPSQANQIFASTHATRARILRERYCRTNHYHSRDQPILCLIDPSFPQQLRTLLLRAEGSCRPTTVLVNVPAYHTEDHARGALLTRLAVMFNLTNDNLRELSADRYYLHSVALLLVPGMRLCFVCDINHANTNYEYINLGHG